MGSDCISSWSLLIFLLWKEVHFSSVYCQVVLRSCASFWTQTRWVHLFFQAYFSSYIILYIVRQKNGNGYKWIINSCYLERLRHHFPSFIHFITSAYGQITAYCKTPKNICVFQVSRPYLCFWPNPKHFIVLKEKKKKKTNKCLYSGERLLPSLATFLDSFDGTKK